MFTLHHKGMAFILYTFTVYTLLVVFQFCEFFKISDFGFIIFNTLSKLLNSQSVSCFSEELSLNKKPLDSISSEENKKIIIGVVAGLLGVGLIVAVYNNPELPAQC
jgi:magnesium-transporting ATPase (P-type)